MANLKAVITRPKVSENYSRNAFDRSFSPKLSYQLGALQPFFAEPCIAGSHIKLNRSIFQRTPAVNTAAFPKVDTHCEFFYVPLRLLWSFWGNYKTKIQDYYSSLHGSFNSVGAFTPESNPLVPTFDLNDVRDCILAKISSPGFTPAGNPYFSTKREAWEANRLLDGLGYGFVKPTDTRQDPDAYVSYTVNAFKLLAYQKVYYDHFRNTSYESNDPSYYNWDKWSFAGVSQPYQLVTKLFKYRYVNYRKDYFNNIYPSLNYSASSPTGSSWVIPNSVVGALGNFANHGGTPVDASLVSGSSSVLLGANTSQSGGYPFMSVQQIRAAFALDKLMRASAYTPKHVKDQFEARYGVKGVESNLESVRIGAMMSDVIFKEVTNMAAGAGVALGAYGAQGVGGSGYEKDIEFTCNEDCIILGLMYSIPRSSYDSTRVRNWNTKISGEDFFIPEFMNLGMQPIYQGEHYYRPDAPSVNVNIMGYQPRYTEYKLGIDVNHGLFNNGMALGDFVVHTGVGRQTTYNAGVGYDFFKVDPHDLDSVFVQATDTADPLTDKFFTYMDVKFICNQNMSVHGQPVNIGA